jgi:NAD(P)-dependent dehydrogenase (short-subunit alcohol dehydrogenase family)
VYGHQAYGYDKAFTHKAQNTKQLAQGNCKVQGFALETEKMYRFLAAMPPKTYTFSLWRGFAAPHAAAKGDFAVALTACRDKWMRYTNAYFQLPTMQITGSGYCRRSRQHPLPVINLERSATVQIQGNSALITGAASGLGAATARRLAAGGAYVTIADMNAEAGAAMVAEIGPNAHFVATNVTDPESCRNAIQTAIEHFGPLRILVNCAGIATAERILGKQGPHDLDRFERTLKVNLIGSFTMLMYAAEQMTGNELDAGGGRGVIINTASIAAFDGQIGQAAYSASKAAIAGMTLPAAREFARHGIRVMTIAPGIFDTAMMAGLPESARASLGEQVPFPSRLGRPEEYAALAQHIIENDMLNGETIRLDGAIRMAPK